MQGYVNAQKQKILYIILPAISTEQKTIKTIVWLKINCINCFKANTQIKTS